MRKVILFILLFMTTFLSSNDKISLQLLWKHQFEFAGFYMAKEKGFYDDVGLDVELKEFSPGIDIVSDVEQGKSTYGITYSSVILRILNNSKIKLLNAMFQSSPHVLISLKSSGIKNINDFKNKRIMMDNDKIKSISFLSMFHSKGVRIEDVKLLKYSFNINDLIDKKTDIMSVYLSNQLYILDKNNIKYDIWNPSKYGFDFYNDILITSLKETQKYPNRVERFKKATIKGWNYAFSNIEETIELILKKYNSQHKTKEALLYEAKILKKLAYKSDTTFGNINKNKIKRIYDIYNLMGLVKNKINIDNFIFNKKDKYLSFQEEQWIKNNTIKIGTEFWKPIVYLNKNTNKLDGIIGDLLNLIIKKLNLKTKIYASNWKDILNGFKNNKYDLLPAVYYSKQREDFGLYSKKIFSLSEYLYIKKDNSNIKTFKDLKNKKLAIIKNYAMIDMVHKKFPSINIIQTKNLQESIDFVLNGKVDALIDGQLIMEDFIRNNLIVGLKSLSQNEFKSNDIYFLSNKTKPILKSILQKGLDLISVKEKNKIISKWLNAKIGIDFLTTEEQKYLKNNRIIKMCNNNNWEPIEFAKDNNMDDMQGIAIDTLKIIEKSLNIKFKNIPTKNWTQSQQFLKEKKCDILPAAIKTNKREIYANFTDPYLHYKLAIITKNNVPIVDSLEDIIDKRMSRKQGSGLIDILHKKYSDIRIVETSDNLDSFRLVENDDVYFTIATLPVASYYITKYAMYNLHIAGYTNMKYNLSIAVRKDNNILLNILNKSLNQITQTKHKEIYNRWTMYKLSIKDKFDYELVKKISFFIIIIIIFFIYRHYSLRQSNKLLVDTVNEQTKELKNINIQLEEKSKKLKEVNENLAQKIVFETEKARSMEKKLFESEKLAAMGEMIGNIAHQWRQPLSVISTASTGILMQHEYDILTDEKLVDGMENINKSAQFLSKTIDDFRDLIKGDAKLIKFNVSKNIEQCLNIQSAMLVSNNIEVITKNIDKSIEIESYPNALIQALINVINNAKDVLVENKISNKYIFINLFMQNDDIVINIKDNGGGISLENKSRIFEAYFTTKHKSMGTGLGLHMTYNMIKNDMNGNIKVSNEQYKYKNKIYTGALFRIILPKIKEVK